MTSHALRRTARRVSLLVLTTLTVALLSVSLLAPSAAATEGEGTEGEPAAAEETGFGAGQWDGLLLAAGAGIVLGLVVFSMSEPGGIAKAEDEHH